MRSLVVYCHPARGSLVAAALEATLDGLRDGGHETRVVDLYASGFDPVFSAAELAAHRTPGDTTADVLAHAEHLRWCEQLVLVYPTWWAGQPAMLKGWIDRVFVNGVAWTLPEGKKRIRPLLRNIRRITVVTTHGSSKFVNALEGEAGKRIATRAIRVLCSRRCRTRWLAMYTVDRSTELERAHFLNRVRLQLAAA